MLDMKTVITKVAEGTADFNQLEEMVHAAVMEEGRALLAAAWQELDRELARIREAGLRMIGKRTRTVLTRLGMLTVKRRYYRDGSGTRFLLDEALGWGGGQAITPDLAARMLQMSSEKSFRRTAGDLSFFLACHISHMLPHRLVQEVGARCARAKSAAAEELFTWGALPECEGQATDYLFLEADGCHVSLQREDRRGHELKVGISYEGMEKRGGQWRTRAKRSTLSASPGPEFLREWSAALAAVYDHKRVGLSVWSSDGGGWLRAGPPLFAARPQLDRFHLARSLRSALGRTGEAARLYSLALAGKTGEVLSALAGHLESETDPDRKKELRRTLGYLAGLEPWLADWRLHLADPGDLRSLGAMEGNVGKLASFRFKGRGMSWTIKGAHHMCQVIELRENRKLASLADHPSRQPQRIQQAFQTVREHIRQDPEAWLAASVPLLQTESGKPWVKEVLRPLVSTRKIA